MRHNIIAYTENVHDVKPHEMVSFVSVNTEAGDHDHVFVAARNRRGVQVEVRIPWAEFRRIVSSCEEALSAPMRAGRR